MEMETVEPQGVTTVKDERARNDKWPTKANDVKKDMYKKRDEMKKDMTAKIGDNFVIRTTGTPSEKNAMDITYQENFRKIDEDTKGKLRQVSY